MSDHNQQNIAKTYTRARKFPQLIGTTPDGQRLPFGPYTYTQFIGAGVAGVVLWQTTWLWATGSFVRNFMVFGIVMGFTVWGLGRLPLGGRNPLSMVHGAGKALTGGMQAPRVGGLVPRRPGIRPISGEVMILPAAPEAVSVGSVALEEEPEPVQRTATPTPDAPSPTAHRRLRSLAHRPETGTPKTERGSTPVLQPSASTNADRLLAMAAASRSTREKV